MTPGELDEYQRLREAREARSQAIDEARGFTNTPPRAATKSWRRRQAIKERHRRLRGNARDG